MDIAENDMAVELSLLISTEKWIPQLLDVDTSRYIRYPCKQMRFSHTAPMATHVLQGKCDQ